MLRDLVRQFHEHIKQTGHLEHPDCLLETVVRLKSLAADIEDERLMDPSSLILCRMQLLLEELAEFLEAVKNRDRLEMLDGLTDLLYVVLGAAVVFDLDIEAAFHEVHRSNMTKQPPTNDNRARNKGPNYSPPDLRRFL